MRECLDQLEYEMQLCGMSPVSQRDYRGLTSPMDTWGDDHDR